MNRIAELRKERHLNQIGLAMKLNISQYMVSAYETGRHQPSTDMLIAFADFFDVSVDYLLCRTDKRRLSDSFCCGNINETEMRLLDLFRALPESKQEQAMGVLFALQQV